MAPAAQHRLALCRSSRCSVAAAKQEQDTSQYDNRCTDWFHNLYSVITAVILSVAHPDCLTDSRLPLRVSLLNFHPPPVPLRCTCGGEIYQRTFFNSPVKIHASHWIPQSRPPKRKWFWNLDAFKKYASSESASERTQKLWKIVTSWTEYLPGSSMFSVIPKASDLMLQFVSIRG